LDNTFDGQIFQPSVPFTVNGVQFDPEYDIISKNNQVLLGTDDLAFDQQLVLYPNPTTGLINLHKPDALQVNQVRIYNTLGQMLYSEAYSETVDVSMFSKGILFFQMETAKGVINKTIVKE
jgi:hypothetical protein